MASAFSTHLLDLLVAQANRYTVANPDPIHVYLLYINDVVLGVYRVESSAVQVAHTIMGSPESGTSSGAAAKTIGGTAGRSRGSPL